MHWEEPAHNLKSCLDMFVRFAVFFSDLKTAAVLSLDCGRGFRYASAFGGEKDMHTYLRSDLL